MTLLLALLSKISVCYLVKEIRVSDRHSLCLLRCVDTTCKDSVCCLPKDDSSVPDMTEIEVSSAAVRKC